MKKESPYMSISRKFARSPLIRERAFGFTLIEILVAVGIFASVFMLVVGSFIMFSRAKDEIQTRQYILESMQVVASLIGKEIRSGTAFSPSDCQNGCDTIVFLSKTRPDLPVKRIEYRRNIDSVTNYGVIQRGEERSYGACALLPLPDECYLPFTPADINVKILKFYIDIQGEAMQPIVTVAIQGETLTPNRRSVPFDVSNSFSPRLLQDPTAIPSNDNIAPSITIETVDGFPVSGSYTTDASSVTFSGIASDNVGVASVIWFNQTTGGSGTADLTTPGGQSTSWNAPASSGSPISLIPGDNIIKIWATDDAGNMFSETIIVTSNAPPPAPTITSLSASCPGPQVVVNYTLNSSVTSTVHIERKLGSGPPPPPPPAPVAYYKFNEGSGQQVINSAGVAPNGYLGSDPGAIDANDPARVAGRDGTGGAVRFNMAGGQWNDAVLVPHSSSLNAVTGLTVSAWIYPTDLTPAGDDWFNIIRKHPNSGEDINYAIALYKDHRINFYGSNGLGSNPTPWWGAYGGYVPLNAWTHIAATYDKTNQEIRIFVDGTQVSRGSQTIPLVPNTGQLRIGAGVASNFTPGFVGDIDDVRIYQAALSPEQILNQYFADKSISVPEWFEVGTDADGSPFIDQSVWGGQQFIYRVVSCIGSNCSYSEQKSITPPSCAPPPQTECNDGIDNDGDGLIDTADPACPNEGYPDEDPECNDYEDNDMDGFIDMADPQCDFPWDNLERKYQCEDGIDNDGDGYCDTASAVCTDGSIPGDPECAAYFDDREDGTPECGNFIDDDGDNLIDAADPGCHTDGDSTNSASYDPVDTSEANVGAGKSFILQSSKQILSVGVSPPPGNSGGNRDSDIAFITVVPSNGFSSSVTLSVISGLPPGGSVIFSDSLLTSVEYSTGSTLFINIPDTTPVGIYLITIGGSGGSISDSLGIWLRVHVVGQGEG